MICSQWHGSLFEYCVTTAKRDIHNLMCSIDAYERDHKLLNEEASSGSVRVIPSDSTEEDLKLFGLTTNFIEIWLKSFKTNYESRRVIFYEEILDLFQKITVTLPKPVYYIEKTNVVERYSS